MTLSQPWGPGSTADGRGRRCKKDLPGWLVGADALDRRIEGPGDPRGVVQQMQYPMGLFEVGIGGLANIRPHGWLRSLGRRLHHEKHRNQSSHR